MTANTLTYSKGVSQFLTGIFDKPLRISGCILGEATYINDSYDTNVVETHGAGLRPVLLLWGHMRQHDDVDTADGLNQVLELAFPKG